ncbi:MAG: rane-bound lytic murein transglycosylase, partial [Pseudomonadota bacterium]|nr:rane-bound lytic murein transglycosylase [Pseudomonadota bacterium]
MTFRPILTFPILLFLAVSPVQATDAPLNLSSSSSLSNAAEVPQSDEILTPAATPVATPAGTPDAADSPLPATEVGAPPSPPQAIDLTTTPDDLLERIRNGFAMPNLTGDLVLAQQQWYLNRPDYLRRMVDRSSRYLHHIVEELEKRGMP